MPFGKYIVLNAMLLTGLTACRTKQTAYLLTPTITVCAQKPAQLLNTSPLPENTPNGMVYVPGGLTRIGAEDGQPWEKPLIWITVRPYFMDEHPVTVGEFRQFINATAYRTEAETLGDAGVFDESLKQWTLKKGANWEYPQGREWPEAPANHPVTQVSWNDASAYATWAGKRLPSEFEWEHAARNAVNSPTRYPFGNELRAASGAYLANTWNGHFPESDAAADGFHRTSPVGHYGKTPLGLTDMTGNVWQWCADWRQTYADVTDGRPPADPTEKVQRGGSFLCEPGWCHGYRVSGRSFSSPETALMHVGFRCVKDLAY